MLKDVVNAHESAWKKARIAHCDISPGNIQIHQNRGILADCEYAVGIDELHTAKAINSGTLLTMPPRLAYCMLNKRVASNISRTPWDEMCSVFLCFIYAVLDERRHPTLDLESTIDRLASRMIQLLDDTEAYCTQYFRPPYSEIAGLISRIQQAFAVLFSHNNWMQLHPDAGSMGWWDKMRHVLNILMS